MTMELEETGPKPMTLADLRREIRAAIGENKSFSIDLEVWDHAGSTGQIVVRWSVYIVDASKKVDGPSPEYVLDGIRRLAAAQPRVQTASERIDEVSKQVEL